jgi:sugar lactone lactonase YvrE
MKRLAIVLASLLSSAVAHADITLTPAWKTAAELKNPESVIYHPGSDSLYVSNVNGSPDAKDGNGFISRLTDEGDIAELRWLEGFDAPKGLALRDDTLYVADIDDLVVVDINSKSIIKRYPVSTAKFLNDVAIDQQGRVYVSDMATNEIYRLADDTFALWMADPNLEAPNGLLIEGNKLIVGSWGNMTDGFATEVPGHLKTIDLDSRDIQSLGDGTSVGNLDGVEADGRGNYLVTDWMNGRLLLISPNGSSETLIEFEQGSADHTVMPEKNLVIIPMMMQNDVVAFRISYQ